MSFAAISGETIALQTLGYWSLNGIIMERKCEDSVVYYEKAASKVVEIYSSGPPLGRSLPKHKTRLTEKRGGVYGYGASGPGNPSIVNKKPGALSQADIILHYEMLSDKGFLDLI